MRRDVVRRNGDSFQADPCEHSCCSPGAFGIYHEEDLSDAAPLQEGSDARGLIARRVAFRLDEDGHWRDTTSASQLGANLSFNVAIPGRWSGEYEERCQPAPIKVEAIDRSSERDIGQAAVVFDPSAAKDDDRSRRLKGAGQSEPATEGARQRREGGDDKQRQPRGSEDPE